MKKLYKIKVKRDKSIGIKYHGGMGHNHALEWDELIDLIIKKGISEVQSIRHDDKKPTNTTKLTDKEWFKLWQDVERKRNSN